MRCSFPTFACDRNTINYFGASGLYAFFGYNLVFLSLAWQDDSSHSVVIAWVCSNSSTFSGETAIVKCLQIHITGILVRVSQTFAGPQISQDSSDPEPHILLLVFQWYNNQPGLFLSTDIQPLYSQQSFCNSLYAIDILLLMDHPRKHMIACDKLLFTNSSCRWCCYQHEMADNYHKRNQTFHHLTFLLTFAAILPRFVQIGSQYWWPLKIDALSPPPTCNSTRPNNVITLFRYGRMSMFKSFFHEVFRSAIPILLPFFHHIQGWLPAKCPVWNLHKTSDCCNCYRRWCHSLSQSASHRIQRV